MISIMQVPLANNADRASGQEIDSKVWIAAAVGLGVVGLTAWWLSRNPEEPVQNYYLFGSPIQNSPSPLLHNTGFKHFPRFQKIKKYSLCETLEIQDVVTCLQKLDTFGGSVTIPHKQAIIPFLDELSPGATAIGAVNTVFKKIDPTTKKTLLVGENTDWKAIYILAQKRLQSLFQSKKLQDMKALIVGAGGTAHAACYAVSQLKIPFQIWNRTKETADKLSKAFGGTTCCELAQIESGSIDLVISTVPPTARFTLPTELLKKNMVIIELVYHPRETELVLQARAAGALLVEGSEILFEQGIVQFQIWTGQDAPLSKMAHALVHVHKDGALKQDTPLLFREILTPQPAANK